MEPKREERRLTTILSADVAGYSRLMAADESGTLARLRAHHKELIEPKAAEYRGRIVKLMGDGILMEFGSVVDAVLFAVEVQRAMPKRNEDAPKNLEIVYRIGINIGDIIVVGDDIYGDGVNIAARLEALAEPGGICVSRNVHSQVKNKVVFGFKDLGEQNVKNIPEPIPTFGIQWGPELTEPSTVAAPARQTSWRQVIAAAVVAVAVIGAIAAWMLVPRDTAPPIEAASLELMAFPLPEKPSIAVLAFETSGIDRNHRFLVYGLVDTIIAELARTPSLFVIAPHSSLQPEISQMKTREAAERFGVKYVLAGSVSGAGEDLTIDARLIDAIGGQQLWRQTLEGRDIDLYRIENEIVNHVRATLDGKPWVEGATHSDAGLRRHFPDGESYGYLLRGIAHFRTSTRREIENSAQFFSKAIESDPEDALANGWSAWNDVYGVMMGWVTSPEQRLERAFATATESVSLDPSLDFGRWAMGATFMMAGDHTSASEQFRVGLDLNPNEPNLLAGAAKSLAFQDAAPEAIEFGRRALRLNPHPPTWYFWNLGIAYYFAGRNEDVIAVLERAPDLDTEARLYLTASYIRSGRDSDAKLQKNEITKTDPAFHIAGYINRTDFANPGDIDVLTTDLLAAGLPENVSFGCMLEPTMENCR
ncbi:MAG: adenylate/guanylate cyclase domain-containing protein [Planctomycetota bacterium]|jgi:adenylate cyclase